MFAYVQPLPVGNAIRLLLTPPSGALYWRVLRRTADAFTGPDDAGAVQVVDECTENAVLDTLALVNGVAYFYRAYSWNGSAWTASETVTGTPAATYAGDTIDPQSIVRDRLQLGLAVEIARGALKPQSGKIPVLTAPAALQEAVTFPAVSVHLEDDSTSQRSLGEMLFSDEHQDGAGGWIETEGWLSRVTLNVVGVSLNSDERIALRQAIQRVITANLPVFDDHGLVQIEFSQRDIEQFSENNAPLYITSGVFTCMAPSYVQNTVGEITDAVSTLTYGMDPRYG